MRGAHAAPPRHGVGQGSSTSAVLALVLVAWLLAAGRWGSYVGVPGKPVYVTEMLLGASLAAYVVEHVRGRQSTALRWDVLRRGLLPLLALLVWAVLRLLLGGDLSTTALRDFAPYGYACIALIAATRSVSRRLVVGVLATALVLHTAWLLIVVTGWLGSAALPVLGRTRVFEVRNDFDGTVSGIALVAAVFALTSRPMRTRPVWALVAAAFAVVNAILVLGLQSRAGLLATFACAALLLLRGARPALQFSRRSTRHALASVAVSVLAMGALALGVASTGAGSRLVHSLDFNGVSTGTAAAPGGTTRSRLEAYAKVVSYVTHRPDVAVVGLGFGPDYLQASGAQAILQGTTFTGVRSPHNFVLGTWARLGIIGALLQLWLVVSVVLAAARAVARRHVSWSVLMAALVVVAIPVAAVVGVVLESPFGAVPFYWGVGVLAGAVGGAGRSAAAIARPTAVAKGVPAAAGDSAVLTQREGSDAPDAEAASAPAGTVLVVVPTLGRRRDYLEACVQSITTQNHQPVIVCLVGPAASAAPDVARGHGVHFLDQPPSGIGAAVNAGWLAHGSSAEVWAWLGDDDLLEPGAVAAAVRAIRRPGVVMAYGRCRYIDEHGQTIWTAHPGRLAAANLGGGWDLVPQPGSFALGSAVREVGMVDERLNFAMDYDLFLRLRTVGRLVYVPSVLASFRWHEDSLTASQGARSAREAGEVRRSHWRHPRLAQAAEPITVRVSKVHWHLQRRPLPVLLDGLRQVVAREGHTKVRTSGQ